jgi:tetratricopeptide (TPR) repeat protein
MTIRAMTMGCLIATVVASIAGCSRDKVEAVNLANEGDKAKAMNIDEAISKYEQAANLDPTNHRIAWKLALAYKKKEDWPKTALAASRAAKVAPDHADYHFVHGYALSQAAAAGPGSWSDAKEPLQQAIAKDPNLADAYFELGEVMLHLDDESAAIQNYTKAIEAKPDNLQFYGPLADLYARLGYDKEAEQVLKEGLAFASDGAKETFALHSLLGSIYELRGNFAQAITEYEAAKKACGQCNEKGEQIAFFNLGAAYAMANPPRKNEAIQQLTAFSKIVCKGGLAQRYADQCAQAQQIAGNLGGSLP